MRRVAVIAAFTALEAVRTRLAWVLALAVLVAAGAAVFAGQLALAEAREVRAALAGALLRLGAAFVVATYVVTSMRREADDRVQEMLLASALTRGQYVAGKLAGYCLVALATAALCAAGVLAFSAPVQALLWGASLACELAIVAGFALFCASGLRHPVAALAATLAFYVLARMMSSLQALGHGTAGATWQTTVLDALALLLPQLSAFAPSAWLVYQDGTAPALGANLLQALIALAVLGSASALDLQRRELE